LFPDNHFPYFLESSEVKGDLISKTEVVIPEKLVPWVSNALLSNVRKVDSQVPLDRVLQFKNNKNGSV